MLRWKIAQWFELRWWMRYLSAKDKLKYLEWKRNYWTELLNSLPITKDFSGKSVLDAGCGPAGIFIALPESSITAIDPLVDRYESSLQTFSKTDYPNVCFINKPIEAYTADRKFDMVFCMNAINHTRNIDAAFDNLVNVLKANGDLVVTIDVHNYKGFQLLFKAIPGDILHPHQYTLQQYKTMLTSRNLNITHTALVKRGLLFNHYVIVATKSC